MPKPILWALRLLMTIAAITTPAQEPPPPESAAPEIAAWALQPPVGEAGRPLPLAGSWMAEKMFGPDRFAELTEQGHHVLITFLDPSFVAGRRQFANGPDFKADYVDEYYRSALAYAREHKLPIAIRGWNWSDSVAKFQDLQEKAGREFTDAERARMLGEGRTGKLLDPFGPVAAWREWGSFWFGNEIMQELQTIYPDPPLVILLNNNEGPKVRNVNEVPKDYPRFVALHGKGPHDDLAVARAIRQGYTERYAAMFAAAREAMTSESWRRNVKFVAYNSLWDTAYIGSGNKPQPGIWFDNDQGWLEWKLYDGSMPELYDNDWQPGKRDYRPHGPQTEAMNYYSALPWLYEQDPDFYWASIVWEGGRVSDVWRSRRGTAKPFLYITRGQRWDFARHEGWVQFCLWATRARTMREFRWPPSERHAYDEGTWRALLRSVDRPWQHPVLREFWQHGELLPNSFEQHPDQLSDEHPEWLRQFRRWYLLSCDANPRRETWTGDTELRVFALALRLDQAPRRRWLVYAHAPLGAVSPALVRVPGAGNVSLPSVPRSGAFYLIREGRKEVEIVLPGGPHELAVQAVEARVPLNREAHFTGAVSHAPGRRFARYAVDFGDGETAELDQLGTFSHRYAKPGTHIVTVTATDEAGETLLGETQICVGPPPHESLQYDLDLTRAFAWRGPWDDSGEPEHELVTWRHVPNGGHLAPAVLSGGRFVHDGEKGQALQLGGPHDAVWLARNQQTVMSKEGVRQQTIEITFMVHRLVGRQVLYAQGNQGSGFNLYLDGRTLYAGSWAPAENMTATGWYPVWGRDWPGYWLSTDIEANRWHTVALVLRDAGDNVLRDRQFLYLDGDEVARGPGVRIPRQYGAPRLGRAHIGKHLLTRFHDGGKEAAPFSGKLAHFRLSTSE